MVDRVGGIGGSGSASSISSSGRSSSISARSASNGGNVSINESFSMPPWTEIDNLHSGSGTCSASDIAAEPIIGILINLFLAIVNCGCMIKPRKARSRNGFVVSASFEAPRSLKDTPKIFLPLDMVESLYIQYPFHDAKATHELVRSYVSQFISNFTMESITHVVIIASHEYGHLQSYLRGNHTKDLENGIKYYMQEFANKDIIENFTWLVFREEYTAWVESEKFLKSNDFEYFAIWDSIKQNSLRAYIASLHLELASVKTFYKLSALGDDFRKNCPAKYFPEDFSLD